VIFFAGIGFRYIELGLLAALVVSAGLIFVRRRSAALLLWTTVVMAALAVHLFLEGDRWQMIPAYCLLFVLAIWLSTPSRHIYRRAGALLRALVVVMLVLPALALPVFVPLFTLPQPSGPLTVGTAVLYPEHRGTRARVAVWYPTDEPTSLVAPFWRPEQLRSARIPGFPSLLVSHLALVPTPAHVRAPVLGEDLPLLLIASGPRALPGDQLSLIHDAASNGWFVARFPPGIGAEALVELIEELTVRASDAAIEGVIDSNRTVLLTIASSEMPDLGFASIEIGDAGVGAVTSGGTGVRLSFPDMVVPDLALTERHRLTLLPALLTGGSDVAPARAHAAVRRFVSSILSDGSPAAPVFAGPLPEASSLVGHDGVGAISYQRIETAR